VFFLPTCLFPGGRPFLPREAGDLLSFLSSFFSLVKRLAHDGSPSPAYLPFPLPFSHTGEDSRSTSLSSPFFSPLPDKMEELTIKLPSPLLGPSGSFFSPLLTEANREGPPSPIAHHEALFFPLESPPAVDKPFYDQRSKPLPPPEERSTLPLVSPLFSLFHPV